LILGAENSDIRQRKSEKENSSNDKDHEATKQILFDIDKIKQIKTDFHKESSFQKTVQFSRDHSLLATGGADGHLRVWKVILI
jgi:prolactin regulatory element-binding protein